MAVLYVLSAEEKVGKSLLAGQIALNVAKGGIPVGIVSMEMKESQIIRRFSGASKWISLDDQRAGGGPIRAGMVPKFPSSFGLGQRDGQQNTLIGKGNGQQGEGSASSLWTTSSSWT